MNKNCHPVMTKEFHKLTGLIEEFKPSRNKLSNASHNWIIPRSTLCPWLDDKEFFTLYEKIKSHTLVDIIRCYELWSLARQTADIDGDILEVGVWRGGTGAILASAVRNIIGTRVFLADTFTGVVKAGDKDSQYKGGEHADTSIEVVQNLHASLALDNIKLLPGIFPDETQHEVNGKLSMVHVDVDVYKSTKDIFEWCLPRLSVGSILVCDDYGNVGCSGITAFCDEFGSRKDFHFIYNINGQAIFFKIK